MYDLLFQNAQIVDGTGAPAYMADLAIVGDEIVAIGKLEVEAARTIDVHGLVVSPGFIDLHTHSDVSYLLDPDAQSKVRQGVTLELVGNCGFSFAAPLEGEAPRMLQEWLRQHHTSLNPWWTDFAGFLEALEKNGIPLNVATQVGHNTVRVSVMGFEARPDTPQERERMKALVADALDAGALGFSTGLFYTPGSYATVEEVIEIAHPVAQRGKLYSTHLRDEGDHNVGLFVALNEALEVGRRTGVRVQISHVKCWGPLMWGRAGRYLELLEGAREEGIDVAGDQYPYTAGSTFLWGALFPRWLLMGGREAALARLRDPNTRSRALREVEALIASCNGPEGVLVSAYDARPEYEGRNLKEVAEEMKCNPAEAALRLYEGGEGLVVVEIMKEPDVERFASHPLIAVASDGWAVSPYGVLGTGKPHPRSYGTFPRFLAQFVRTRGLVPLEEAVRKMTLLPASRLGLTRRGRIAPRFKADLVVFDPNTVADTATYRDPHRYPTGIRFVFVNGVPVVEEGHYTGRRPGRVLRDFHQ